MYVDLDAKDRELLDILKRDARILQGLVRLTVRQDTRKERKDEWKKQIFKDHVIEHWFKTNAKTI